MRNEATTQGLPTGACASQIRFPVILLAGFGFTVLGAGGCGSSTPATERTAARQSEVVITSSSSDADATSQQDTNETTTAVESDPSRRNASTAMNADVANYRMPKLRTAPDDSILKSFGLRRVESRRLLLITDSPDPELDHLPTLADQLFDVLESWFGELPPAANGADFQVIGHVMADRSKFRAAGLLPDESFTIRHGRHLRYAFWAEYPNTSYYRRHLALHEFVHCFMMCEYQEMAVPPPWYIEGMAEFFATHSVAFGFDGPKATFGVMPPAAEGFEDWGRIRAFREQFAEADHKQLSAVLIPSLNKVVPDRVAIFESPFQYSASWAACWFFKNHPQTSNLIQALAKERTYVEFIPTWERQRNDLGSRLAVDWLLFSEQLDFGFDPVRCFPIHANNTVGHLVESDLRDLTLRADRGWQDTGLLLDAGSKVNVTCTGRCIMHETSIPWESTAAGISIDYYRGHRLGQVIAVIVSRDGKEITDRLPIGIEGVVTAPFAGRLWLQANDSCDSRSDNLGDFQVRLDRLP